MLSVDIPSRFLSLARDWYGGQDDMLYAVASSGDLYLGSIRPIDDDGQPMTDDEWYLSLWENLSYDLQQARRLAELGESPDSYMLDRFHRFVCRTVQSIRRHTASQLLEMISA